ncbi:unnamed protein product [Taenia asiatica]|uniref:SET domain-containing protein n=1 Tax=Taenia asiatica TaxID=60517 RepID=A0A0R3VU32_TAEAS|nr:unnamed protein product [Taenia asiatica]
MGKKTRLQNSFPSVAGLCSELLRLCDVHPDASKAMDYFRSLYEITVKIRDLQKGASTSRLFLSGEREVRLESLKKRYEMCFYSPLSICNYGEAGFGLRADESIENNFFLKPRYQVPIQQLPISLTLNSRSSMVFPQQVTTDYDPDSERIIFYAMESYRQGDEVFMDYGKRTSTEFLLYNGFVPESNPFHKVPVKLGAWVACWYRTSYLLDVVCCLVIGHVLFCPGLSKFDKFVKLRTKVLEELGLGSEICPVASPQDGAFPSSQLAAFARVFVMNESKSFNYHFSTLIVELQTTLDELISGSPGPHVAARLLSVTLSNDRVDAEAKKFIEGRINLLIRSYESRLAKSLQTVPSASPVCEQCIRLCRHDIVSLSQCLAALSEQSC